jgi:hypothetical protein
MQFKALCTLQGVEIWLQFFLTSALNGGGLLASRSDIFTPEGKSHRHPLNRKLGGAQRLSTCSEAYDFKAVVETGMDSAGTKSNYQ